MNAQTKLSAKGQVVIPKSLRERLKWDEGAELEVIETANGVLLRPVPISRERITIEEFEERVPPHDGPPLSLAQMDEAVEREAARRHQVEYKRLPK